MWAACLDDAGSGHKTMGPETPQYGTDSKGTLLSFGVSRVPAKIEFEELR
jgi:hypothetical protein